jgi:hypothetical protein
MRLLSIVITLTFFCQQLVWAAGDMTVAHNQMPAENVSTFTIGDQNVDIPLGIAQVDSSFNGTLNERIINIKDTHSSLSAQYSIVNILSNLVENYDLSVVAIEGGNGYIDTSILKSFPDQSIKHVHLE